MSVTIKDVAKAAGVSHSTVSRALHGSQLISETTTQRVRQVAKELGYLPSAAARSLKTRRSQVLGVVVNSLADPFFSEIVQGVEAVTQEWDYRLFVAASERDPRREQKIVQAMMEHRVDGVIICSTSFSSEQGRLLSAYGLPIVVVNNQAAEAYHYAIYHDDVDGSRQVTRYLIALGHRRIAYLGNASSGRTTQDRLTGFQHEMNAAGLPVPGVYIHQERGGEPDHGLAAARYFLNLPMQPTALVCFNDMMAIGLLKGYQQAGVRIPQQLSLTGFDNIVFSAYTRPALTTFEQPKRYIGAEAARLVLGLLKSPPEDADQTKPIIRLLPGKLVVRESTAPPGV